jgi:hypothetical protein
MPDPDVCPHCGEALPEPDGPNVPLLMDGETFEIEKMSFGERKQIRSVVRELVVLDNPEADPDADWSEDDWRLAFAIVAARRSKPEFSVQDGLKLTPAELEPPPAPPTRRAAKAARAA